MLSCGESESKYETIYVRTITHENISDTENNPAVIVVAPVNGEYFTIEFQSVSNGEYYIATKRIKSQLNAKMVSRDILGGKENDKPKQFQSNEEFLNFMAAGGYEVVARQELKYGFDYSFKKK